MSSAKMLSDQNGYAGMNSSCATAFSETTTIPAQRASLLPAQTPKPTAICSTPRPSMTQPHVLRSLMT
jgi:hypothetical protein